MPFFAAKPYASSKVAAAHQWWGPHMNPAHLIDVVEPLEYRSAEAPSENSAGGLAVWQAPGSGEMRTSALVVGMFGGFMGVYFAQLLVTGTALVGMIAAAFGSKNAEGPLVAGLLTLAVYTLGIIGGSLAIQRPRTAGLLMLLAGLGGLAATISAGVSMATLINPTPAPTPSLFRPAATPVPTPAQQTTAGAAAYLVLVPFVAPGLLILGGILALIGSRSRVARPIPQQAAAVP